MDRRSAPRLPVIAIALALAVPGVLRAEEAGVVEVAPIVVTDERPVELYEDGPGEVQVLTEEDIKAMPGTNAAEVVKMLPGIRTQQRVQGEEAAVSIEGMPPEYTKILVNGQRYTGAIDEVADLRDVPLMNVQRIEVLRGAQTIRYGPDAAGGVINVVTREPPAEGLEVSVDTGGGDDGQILGGGFVGGRLGPLGFTVTTVHDQIDGFDTRTDADGVVARAGGEDSRRRSDDVYSTFRFDAGDSLELRSSFGWRIEDEDIVPIDGGEDITRNFTRWLGGGGADWYLGERTTVSSEFTYFRGLTESEVGREFEINEDEYKFDLSAEHEIEFGEMIERITIATDLRRTHLGLDEGPLPATLSDADLSPADDVRESFYQGGFSLNSETQLWGRVTLEAGVRAQVHSDFPNRVLPQLGMLFQPIESLKLRASWGRNYRTPSLRDLFQPPVPQLGGTYFLAGNPDLRPESQRLFRVGFEWNPRPWMSLAATGFWNDIENLIRALDSGSIKIGEREINEDPPICLTNPGLPLCTGPMTVDLLSSVFQSTNLDDVRTRGVETQLRLVPHERVDLWLAYTFMDTKVDAPDRPSLTELPNSPKHVADAIGRFRMPWLDTLLTLTAQWRGRAVTESSGTGLASFVGDEKSNQSLLLGLRVVQPIWREFEVYADFRNLTDEEVVDSYEVRGRTFFVGFRGNFSWKGL